MTEYNITVPVFVDERRVQFTATINSLLIEFIAEWWDDLWHLAITRNGEKRSCTLFPNAIHFNDDPIFSLSTVVDKEAISYADLSGLTLIWIDK